MNTFPNFKCSFFAWAHPLVKEKMVLKLLIILALGHQTIFGQQQVFNASIPSTIDLTGANATCATPGSGSPNIVSIPVTGVGTLSATNALAQVSVTLDNSCTGGSMSLNNIAFRIIAPDGTCSVIYAGGLSGVATGSHTINLVSSASCLNNPATANDPTSGANESVTGNYGFFNAYDGAAGVNLATLFSGKNADGTWRIAFSETTGSEPCVAAASLFFGDPALDDQAANGDNCATPIIWDGGPICASTNGKTPSTQMPGSSGGTTFGTIGGSTCAWNGNNNNDVWIQFTPTSADVCISISGLDLSLQSIIVEDSNADSDNNPCTGTAPTGGANDTRWNIMSCPRNALYTTTSGTQLNQQHCFTATVGKTYFMVVDGNGGAESPFYIAGVSGLPAVEPPASCPITSSSAAPANVTITNSTCTTHGGTPSGGSFAAPAGTPCPAGSTIQYSTDNGTSWSATLPTYDQDGPAQSVITRCNCNTDNTVSSLSSTAVTTVPAACPTCSDGIQNGDETGVDCGGANCSACVAPCSVLSGVTPNNVSITNSSCGAGCTTVNGSISAPSPSGCPANSHIEYSTDGTTYTTTLPGYAAGLTVYTRCECDSNSGTISTASSGVTTNPAPCANPSAPIGSLNIVNSTCASACTLSGGAINIGSVSGSGGTLNYSTDNGNTWSASLPSYDQDGPAQTIVASVVDANGCRSTNTTVGTTTPGTCPGAPAAPAGVTITNSTCVSGIPTGGSFNGFSTACSSGGTLTFYNNASATTGATTTEPVYDTNGPAQTLYMRCVDSGTGCQSGVTTVGPTNPATVCFTATIDITDPCKCTSIPGVFSETVTINSNATGQTWTVATLTDYDTSSFSGSGVTTGSVFTDNGDNTYSLSFTLQNGTIGGFSMSVSGPGGITLSQAGYCDNTNSCCPSIGTPSITAP